jgi:Domain of unknown function (DUF4167)
MRSGLDQRPGTRSSQSYRGAPQRSQSFDSHGPGDRLRGNASQIYARYLALAREAARTDDRVASENYYRHAEHYFRINNLGRDGNSAGPSRPIDHATGETALTPTKRSEIEQPGIPAPEL